MTVKTLNIDVTLPADDAQPDKSEFRSKWTEIKSKYESLAGQALRYRGAWVSSSYLSGDVVTYNGKWWYASTNLTTEVPGVAAAWVCIGTGDVIDEDDMVSDSATRAPSQQSVKAYVDTAVGDALSEVLVDTTWPVTPPTVSGGVMTITDAHLSNLLSATDNEVTLENRVIPLLNNGDPSAAFEVRLQFGATAGGEIVAFRVMSSQSGAVTIVSDDDGSGGLVDGVASITPPSRGIFTVVRLAGATKNYETSINDTPTFRGEVTAEAGIDLAGSTVTGAAAAVITRGAASSQPTAGDSGAWITTDGNLTIPNSLVGWNCTLEFDANRTLTFNSQTWASGAASGDIVSVFVKSSSAIRITPLVAAADIITEGDFA